MKDKTTVKKENDVKENVSKLGFSVIPANFRAIPSFEEKPGTGREYVNWGSDNKLPMYLWKLYINSALLNSIINGTVDYISGNGVELNSALSKFSEEVNEEGDTIEDLVRKLSVDYAIYDGFAFQVINDRGGELKELYWVDIRKCRLDEEETKVYYCDKWASSSFYGTNQAIEYPIWEPGTKAETSIYYFKGHHTRGIYPIPRYSGALASIETSTEIGKFHLNNILNNMASSAIISFNDGKPTEEERKQIEKKVREKFSGADNAGKFLLTFNDSKEKAVTVERLAEDKVDEKFQTLSKSTQQEIFIAFRATPELFGMSTEGNGFSKEEYLQAFELYNKTVISPAQKDIKRCFDKVFDTKDSILFNTFSIYENEDGETKINTTISNE